jgi:hypothetical protein
MASTEALAECNWIEPGELLSGTGLPRVCAVRRLVERPSRALARRCLAAGWLRDTLVLVAKASTLRETAERVHPILCAQWRGAFHGAIGRAQPGITTGQLGPGPRTELSRVLAETLPERLAVAPLQAATRAESGSLAPVRRGPWVSLPRLVRPGYAL